MFAFISQGTRRGTSKPSKAIGCCKARPPSVRLRRSPTGPFEQSGFARRMGWLRGAAARSLLARTRLRAAESEGGLYEIWEEKRFTGSPREGKDALCRGAIPALSTVSTMAATATIPRQAAGPKLAAGPYFDIAFEPAPEELSGCPNFAGAAINRCRTEQSNISAGTLNQNRGMFSLRSCPHCRLRIAGGNSPLFSSLPPRDPMRTYLIHVRTLATPARHHFVGSAHHAVKAESWGTARWRRTWVRAVPPNAGRRAWERAPSSPSRWRGWPC